MPSSNPELQQRRRADDDLVSRVLAQAGGRFALDWDPITLGRLLMVTLGALSLTTGALLHPDRAGWIRLGAVSVVMTVLLVGSWLVPWADLNPRTLLFFPVVAQLAFAGLGWDQHGLFAPIGGFSVLCFLYVGLTQPPRSSFLLLPSNSLALVLSYESINGQVWIRLLVSSTVQIILAEVMAGYAARQASLFRALRSAAYSDALTGVPNRRDFDTVLTIMPVGTVVVALDLDHFKQLNDTEGHSRGDIVLAAFGGLLRTSLRANDYCARTGGEEFVLLLANTSTVGTEVVLKRLRERWSMLQPAITFSAGVAVHTAERTGAQTLAAADRALYAAKDAGRNTYRFEVAQSADAAR